MIGEFERLCKGFTFVDLWDYTEIASETFQMYARNVPTKEASCNFVYSVKILHYKININQSKSIDLQHRMYSNQEWTPASSKIGTFLDQKSKEQETVCFSKVPYYNVHIINMVYSSILNFLFAMIFHNKLILAAFEGSKC